jgi:anti-sigma regulatory factor (Ser/Thr protein kinase)
MEVALDEALELDHLADVGNVRRRFQLLAAERGLDENRASDAALIATELATNVIKHATHGGVFVGTVTDGDRKGLAIVAWDRGRGMNIEACLRDGMSTAGTAGAGLGAISRLATQWDAYSQPGRGSVIGALVLARGDERPPDIGIAALAVPYPGQQRCGDAWRVHHHGDQLTALVCDGLGHGGGAADASAAVIASFLAAPEDELAAILDRAHQAARATRGAAGTIVRLDLRSRVATIAGVGNVQAWIHHDALKPLVTQHGTLGHTMPRVREEQVPFPPGATLILHSDGLKSRMSLENDPLLLARTASTVATVLWRDLTRGRDDATIVVVKERG